MEGKVDFVFILDECKIEDVLYVELFMKEELKVVVVFIYCLFE